MAARIDFHTKLKEFENLRKQATALEIRKRINRQGADAILEQWKKDLQKGMELTARAIGTI